MSEMTSNAGVLKMVRVNKGKKDRKSRSLVFRISRTVSKSSFDDSGIQCISAEEESSSDDEIGNHTDSSNIRIPKSVLDENEEIKSEVKESKLPDHVQSENEDRLFSLENEDGHFTFENVHENLTLENVDDDFRLGNADDNFSLGNVDDDFGLGKIDENFTLGNVDNHFTLENVDENFTLENLKSENFESSSTNMDSLNFKNVSSTAATPNVSNSVSEPENTKSYDLRRSSRRILLRFQKDCESVSSVNQTSDIDEPPSVSYSRNSEQLAFTGYKRRRGRRTGPRASIMNRTCMDELPVASSHNSEQLAEECKRRPYSWRGRGRPPKHRGSSMPMNFDIISPITGSVLNENEKLLFQPPKNSVWTLVPKKFLDSDFFKSHVITVGCSGSTKNLNRVNFSAPTNFSSPAVPAPVPFNNEKTRLKYPNVIVNTVPVLQRPNNDDFKDCKRPTVIYFKAEKKALECTTSQQTELSTEKPPFSSSHFTKTRDDLLYLSNKYRLLENNGILKNYYESANGDLNETENMIVDLLSRTKETENSCALENNLIGDSIPDFGSSDTIYSQSGGEDISDDVDTLSRGIIVESLRILYAEEAVLS